MQCPSSVGRQAHSCSELQPCQIPSLHPVKLAYPSSRCLDRLAPATNSRKNSRAIRNRINSSSLSAMRKSYHIEQPGSLARLQLREEAIPELKQGQATVEVHAIGLNMADLFSVLGLYAAFSASDRTVPGLEFSGIVTNVNNDGDSSIRVGDRVVGITKFGAYSTHVNLELPYLRRIPESWGMEEAASFPCQALTAVYGLKTLGALRPNSCLLVHSAAGGVGLAALNIAKRFSCSVLGTVGSPSKIRFLQDLFLAGPGTSRMQFVARTSPSQFRTDAAAFLKQQGRPGFDVVFDSLQGDYFQPGYDLLAPCGRCVVFGAGALTPGVGADASSLSLSSFSSLVSLLNPSNFWSLQGTIAGYLKRPKLDLLNLPGENKGVLGFNLIWLYENIHMFEELYQSLEALEMDAPLVGSTYPFSELPQALEHLQSGKSTGKVIVEV